MAESEILDAIRVHVDGVLRLGFDGAEQAAESAVNLYADEPGYPGNDVVHQLAKERLQLLLAEQASWTRPTDAERLDAAFRRLNEVGILARHNYGPTRTWGRGDLVDEARHARARGMPARGYVYYTSQDAEALSEGCLFLAFGAVTVPGTTYAESAAATQAIADEIESCLSADGLEVDWDGDTDSAMLLRELTWNCPRDADGASVLRNAHIAETDAPLPAEQPRRLLGLMLTKDDELWVVVTVLACDGSNAAEVAIEVVSDSLTPEAQAGAQRGPAALAFTLPGLELANKPVRFDLIAAPANLLHAGRRRIVELADVVSAIVRDPENDFESLEELRQWLGNAKHPTPIVLLVDAPARALVGRLRGELTYDVVEIDFGNDASPVMTAMKLAAKLAMQRMRAIATG